MSNIPQLDIATRTRRCSQRLPMSCRYRVDHVFIPNSNQKEIQDFITNCAEQFENSKMEVSHHPTMHLINKRRVLKPRYNNGRYVTQTQRNDIASRQKQNTIRKPLPPVYEEENQLYEVEPPNIFQSEYNENNLISIPKSIRIRMYHRNEMIQPNSNEEETNDQQLNNDAIDQDLPIPPYEEFNENNGEEINENEIDQAAEYTESIKLNDMNEAQNAELENQNNLSQNVNDNEKNDNVENQNNDANQENDNTENQNNNDENENDNTENEENVTENQNNDAANEDNNTNQENEDINEPQENN